MTNPPHRCLAGFSIMAVCQCLYPITNLCQGTRSKGPKSLRNDPREKRHQTPTKKGRYESANWAMTKSCCFEVLDIPSLSRVLLILERASSSQGLTVSLSLEKNTRRYKVGHAYTVTY